VSVVILVRHGQASFGTEDYDRLSVTGLRQSEVLGASLADHGVTPSRLVSGRMRRQSETAVAMAKGANWDHEVRVDPAWDEFDVMNFLQTHSVGPAATDSRAFQHELDAGMRRWADGAVLEDTSERFSEFTARVESGLQRLLEEQAGQGPAIVSTSAGAISWVVTSLIGGGVEQWVRLNRVCINAAVTKVVQGRQGMSLVSFNEHGHFQPSEVTYR
jgi:broad specificity phosphatase PhoE